MVKVGHWLLGTRMVDVCDGLRRPPEVPARLPPLFQALSPTIDGGLRRGSMIRHSVYRDSCYAKLLTDRRDASRRGVQARAVDSRHVSSPRTAWDGHEAKRGSHGRI
jgi:hypothetical protein